MSERALRTHAFNRVRTYRHVYQWEKTTDGRYLMRLDCGHIIFRMRLETLTNEDGEKIAHCEYCDGGRR